MAAERALEVRGEGRARTSAAAALVDREGGNTPSDKTYKARERKAKTAKGAGEGREHGKAQEAEGRDEKGRERRGERGAGRGK